MPQHRFFYCFKPNLAEASKTVRYNREIDPSMKFVRPSHLHVTVWKTCLLPTYRPDIEELMKAAGSGFSCPPRDLAFDQLLDLGDIAMLKSSEYPEPFSNLFAQINELFGKQDYAQEGQHFDPHITVGHRSEAGPSYQRTYASLIWQVKELFLIHSLHGAGRHRGICRWRLDDRQLWLPLENAVAA